MLCGFEVTAQVRAAQELSQLLASAEAERRQFRELVENLPDLAWTARPDGYIDYYNRRWYEYTGTTPEQMSGWGWKTVHAPEVLEQVVQRWQSSLATGQPFEMEFPLRGADGVFRWFLTRVHPLYDESGNVVRWFGSNTNIDERRRNEDFKEGFLGILGYDLRNPLNTILTTSRVLIRRPDISPEVSKRLDRMVSSGVRMQRMIEQLLDLTRARLGGGIPLELSAAVPLEPLVTKIVDEVRAAHPQAEIELRTTGLTASLDPDRFEQVVSNLVGNAVAHGDPNKPIRVSLEADGSHARLRVHNEGKPIDPHFLPILFSPFARGEKPHGRSAGLGLGLYISERIVAAHDGSLSVDSSADSGTTFQVTIPTRSVFE